MAHKQAIVKLPGSMMFLHLRLRQKELFHHDHKDET